MASGAHGSFVSLHAPWQQEATPQLSADTGDVMDKVRRRLEDIIRSAFTRSGRSMATFCHNTEWSVPGSPAYHRFMAAVHPNGGALSTVSLAIACTPRENVDSICEHGLRMKGLAPQPWAMSTPFVSTGFDNSQGMGPPGP